MTIQGLEMTVLNSHPRLCKERRELPRSLSAKPKLEWRWEEALLRQVDCLTNWTYNKTKGTEEGDLSGPDLYLRHAGSQIFLQYLSRVSGQESWQPIQK